MLKPQLHQLLSFKKNLLEHSCQYKVGLFIKTNNPIATKNPQPTTKQTHAQTKLRKKALFVYKQFDLPPTHTDKELYD